MFSKGIYFVFFESFQCNEQEEDAEEVYEQSFKIKF